MARGWESKSVEEQIDMAEAPVSTPRSQQLAPRQIAEMRKRENLLLSRTRVARELNASKNPRYQVVMQKALAELDSQLAALDPK